jgi:hypothetical protein
VTAAWKAGLAVLAAMILVGVAVFVFIDQSRSIEPPGPPPARAPVARFTATPGPASTVRLTSLSSAFTRGGVTCTWVIDGRDRASGCRAAPAFEIGYHEVELTVRDRGGRTATSRRSVGPVVWRGTPYRAQRDSANPGNPLPTSPVGPWRVVACENNGYSLVNRRGGVGAFTVRQGDHPGTTGGDRCAITLNEAYKPYINPNGLHPREPRFYRIDVGVPRNWPRGRLAGYETFAEWHGVSSGPSMLTIGTTPDNRGIQFSYAPSVNGVILRPQHFDVHPLAPGRFHSYVVELFQSTDPRRGYFRLWRDGLCRTCGDPRADARGRVFGTTQKIVGGVGEPQAFGVENYRSKEIEVRTTVLHRDTMIGPTYASVTGSAPQRLDRAR